MYITRRLHAFYMEKYELSFSKKALLKPMSSILDITSVQGRVNMAFTKTMNSNQHDKNNNNKRREVEK